MCHRSFNILAHLDTVISKLLFYRFRYGQLVEINSHGLFSKWFSESGKLVVKMFEKIRELIEDPEALVCILMDEVMPTVTFEIEVLDRGCLKCSP